jgi:pyruvate/2-oxoglutarate dehydrogenase complex dihydrolipoamide dehydrogenase (E3) component
MSSASVIRLSQPHAHERSADCGNDVGRTNRDAVAVGQVPESLIVLGGGAVGLELAQAFARIGTTRVPSSARGWIHNVGNQGLIKLVEDADRGVLVGATSIGPHGGEVLSLLALAVHAAVPTDQLRQMIYAYPTFHRAVEDALAALG